jgi:hypothetical protein
MYRDSHGRSSAIQCKDVYQRHFMYGCAITHPRKSKYSCLPDQLSLV